MECSAGVLPNPALRLTCEEKTSMDRAIPWSIGGALLLAAAAALVVGALERKNPAFDFIAGNRPVSEDQVRQKLLSDGWANVQIVVRGRYFVATASKDGRTDAFSVDSLTGRLRGEDDDDDDWAD
jgi:hypothetical protein